MLPWHWKCLARLTIKEEHFMTLLFLLLGCVNHTRTGVFWGIRTDPVVFYEDVELICNTSLADECFDCPYRWYGGHDMKLLTYNNLSTDIIKYSAKIIRGGVSLTIKNFNEKDVDEQYSCSVGFETQKKILNMQDKFELRPTDQTVNFSCIFDDQYGLVVRGQLKKVHPAPNCTVSIDKLPVLVQYDIVKTSNSKPFFMMEFEFQLDVEKIKCSVNLEIRCLIGSKYYDILKTNLVRNCRGHKKQLYNIYVILATCLCFTIVGVCCYVWYRKRTISLNQPMQDDDKKQEQTSFMYDKDKKNKTDEMLLKK